MQRKKAKRQAANGYDGLKSGADRLLVQAGSNGRVRNGVLKKVRGPGVAPMQVGEVGIIPATPCSVCP